MSETPPPLPEAAPAAAPARPRWPWKYLLSALGGVVTVMLVGWLVYQHHSNRWKQVPAEFVWEMLTNSSLTAPLVRHQGSIEAWLQKKSHAESTVGCFYQAVMAQARGQEDAMTHFIGQAIRGGSVEAITFLAEVKHRVTTPNAGPEAQERWDSSDVLLREAAGQGFVPAQWLLGLRYAGQHPPTGLPTDLREALHWFHAAGTNGLVQARVKLVELLAESDLKLEARDEQWPVILRWAEALEGQGHAVASYLLGLRQMKQAETRAQYRQAQRQLQKAARKGSLAAWHALGQIHFAGLAGKTDYTTARAAFLQAAQKGYRPSQCSLGEWAYHGYGATGAPTPNYEEALKWFSGPAAAGDANAQYYCGLLALRLQKDGTTAKGHFERAAAQQHPEAMLYLGAFLERSSASTTDDFRRVRDLYAAAAAAGVPRAKYALGMLLRSRAVDGGSEEAAVRYFREAAEQNYPLAELALGDAYRLGQGVPKSLCEALRWYRKSADHLSIMACERLAECYASGVGPLGPNPALAESYRAQANRLQAVHAPYVIF